MRGNGIVVRPRWKLTKQTWRCSKVGGGAAARAGGRGESAAARGSRFLPRSRGVGGDSGGDRERLPMGGSGRRGCRRCLVCGPHERVDGARQRPQAGRAWRMSPATSSTRIPSPRFLTEKTSYRRHSGRAPSQHNTTRRCFRRTWQTISAWPYKRGAKAKATPASTAAEADPATAAMSPARAAQVSAFRLVSGVNSALVTRTILAPFERIKLEYLLNSSKLTLGRASPSVPFSHFSSTAGRRFVPKTTGIYIPISHQLKGAHNKLRRGLRCSHQATNKTLSLGANVSMIWQAEGLLGFWRGNFINLLRVCPYKAINFCAFDTYRAVAVRQGLTLVHFSAQPKPFWSHLPVPPCLTDWGKIMHPTYPTKCAYVEPRSGGV